MSRHHTIHKLVRLPVGVLMSGVVLCAEQPRIGGDIVVIRSDSRSIVFEFTPRYAALRTVSFGGREFLVQHFDGASEEMTSAATRGPDLRYRTIALAFPSPGGNTVRVLSTDYEDMQGVSLAPVPVVRMKDDLPDAAVYEPDPQRYAAISFQPEALAVLSPIGRVRDLLLGGVKVYPVQFNPAARTLRRYSRIVVEVTYGSPAAVPRVRDNERLLASVPLNYNVARTWGTVTKTSAAPSPSVLASGEWYRLTVTEEGMYKLDASYLAAIGITIATIDPRTIKVYGNGGREVPEFVTSPRPTDLNENAIFVSGESDGKFDAGDYIAFFGRGARGWSYDPAGKTLRHHINRYSESNYYWLTFGVTTGKRMTDQPSLPSSSTDVIADRCIDGVVVEEEKVNLLSSGKDWYGQSVGPGSSFTYMHALPGLVPNDLITYRYTLLSHAEEYTSFTVRQNGAPIGTHTLSPIFGYTYATAGSFQVQGTSSLISPTSQLSFQFNASGVASIGWIDWVEILYPRMLWAVNDSLHFRGPDTSAVVEYRLQQFTAAPIVFNVTSHDNARIVSGVSGSFTFRATETAGTVSEYCAVGQNSFRKPLSAVKLIHPDPLGLRGYADGADFIIVTSPEFRSAAKRLKEFREIPAHGGLTTYVADVNEIYNEFGGGIPDVTAIRDFLKYAFDTWTPRPQFVLFLGQASYDYKGILGSKTSYVPTWQSPESRDDVASYCTDDFFARFGATTAPSLVLGRLSARTAAEAEAFVDKLQRYEGSSFADSWKMRMLFIGDDAWTPEGGEVGDGTLHSGDAETLASYYTPDEVEKRKIFIAEYPTVYTAQGRRKPGAYQAIIDQINQGVLIVNYAGHGNPTLLAHENIFNVASSIPQLTNADRLSVFFLATCNFSQFDDPKRYSGSEYLINKPDGAAIGVVSASRKVYAGANAGLNQATYSRLFTRDVWNRVSVERPATALFQFKATGGNSDNDQKFFFMGDPTMRLQFPRGHVSIDSINGEQVDSVGGVPRASALQLRSLSRVTVSGTVRDAANNPDQNYRGRVTLTINDATRLQTIVNFYPGMNWNYSATGGTIYRGENSVTNGRFVATFIVPKDIQYADSTARGRLVAYLFREDDRAADGEGYTAKIRIGGTDSTAVNDNKGPSIGIYLGNRSFRAGDAVGEQPVLLVDFVDSNGINTSVSGIGHRIEAWVNNAAQSRDLTEFYTSKLDSYREGTLQYRLGELPPGKNTIRIRAWDSFDNSAVGETFFEVATTDRLTVSDVFNYPNPFGGSGTSFTFRQNQSTPLQVTVKVFTLAGRLIQVLDAPSAGSSFVRVPWDGRDRDGDVIANGVYLYKVVVKTTDGRFTSETLGKLSKVQ